MSSITDLVVHFGDVIELSGIPFSIPLVQVKNILLESPHWKRYNPHKLDNNRWGLSVTSLDGEFDGVPDLYSLREYNMIHRTRYSEHDFHTRTSIVEEVGLNAFLDIWGDELGRTHFLRLNQGGFFPYHRDNGIVLPPTTARVLIPIDWNPDGVFWIQDNSIVRLKEGSAYFINTSKPHTIFSTYDSALLLVLNINITPSVVYTIARMAKIL